MVSTFNTLGSTPPPTSPLLLQVIYGSTLGSLPRVLTPETMAAVQSRISVTTRSWSPSPPTTSPTSGMCYAHAEKNGLTCSSRSRMGGCSYAPGERS